MSALGKFGRLLYYCSDPELGMGRARGLSVRFLEELLTLKRKFSLQPNALIDIGANHGEYLRAFRYVFGAKTTIAFEPAPDLYANLKERFTANGYAIYPYAIGAFDSRQPFFIASDRGQANSLRRITEKYTALYDERVSVTKTIEVDVRTLDSVIDAGSIPGPLFIKANANNGLDVLRGAERAMRHAVCVKFLHNFDEYYEAAPTSAELMQFMAERGFTSFFQSGVSVIPGAAIWCDLTFFNSALQTVREGG